MSLLNGLATPSKTKLNLTQKVSKAHTIERVKDVAEEMIERRGGDTGKRRNVLSKYSR